MSKDEASVDRTRAVAFTKTKKRRQLCVASLRSRAGAGDAKTHSSAAVPPSHSLDSQGTRTEAYVLPPILAHIAHLEEAHGGFYINTRVLSHMPSPSERVWRWNTVRELCALDPNRAVPLVAQRFGIGPS